MSSDVLAPTAASWALSSSMTTAGRVHRRLAPLLMSGIVVSGSSVGTSNVVQARVIEGRQLTDRTTAGGPPPLARPQPATAETVRRMLNRSGLTGEELARLFGVSRRALYKWAEGGRLNGHHAEALTRLDAIISGIDASTGDPRLTRTALMTRRSRQPSVYMMLLRRLQPSKRPAGPEPAELLTGRWDVDVPVGEVLIPNRRLPKPPAER